MLQPYAFKKKRWKILARTLDGVGYLFRRPPHSQHLVPKRLLVVRLDQLGDMVQTLPLLESLKNALPTTKIDFLTSPVGAELLGIASKNIGAVVWNCPWFDARRVPNLSFWRLLREIRARHYDCAFELRGDIRLISLLRLSGVKNIVGFDATGGGLLLDVDVPWNNETHAIDRNLSLLESIGQTVTARIPKINLSNGIKMADIFDSRLQLAVHPDAGTSAKQWPAERFAEVIDGLLSQFDIRVHLIGLNAEIGNVITGRVRRPIYDHMGKTSSLLDMISLLNGCDGLLSNDSGPAHVMAALGKPVWIVWSGTADKKVWSPRGPFVHILEHAVSCAPCSLARCPVPGHPCLSGIASEEVVHLLVEHFKFHQRATTA